MVTAEQEPIPDVRKVAPPFHGDDMGSLQT